jgi:GNAT superfamily N-acetyltransferase
MIKAADFRDDRVKALLARHLQGMHTNTPPGHVFALDWSGLQMPEISFYALWEGDELLGFGALKEVGPRAGEIKSMRTADAHLRRGVAATILDHIIAEARRRGSRVSHWKRDQARPSSPHSPFIASTASPKAGHSATTRRAPSINSCIVTCSAAHTEAPREE